jgi:hypothetical protein
MRRGEFASMRLPKPFLWEHRTGEIVSLTSRLLVENRTEAASKSKGGLNLEPTYHLEDDLDHKAAAGTDSHLFAIAQVRNGNLEAVATRARVVVDLEVGVEGHVLDFYLVVIRHDGG